MRPKAWSAWIENLDIPSRLRLSLYRNHITTEKKAQRMIKDYDIWGAVSYRNIGDKSIAQLREAMSKQSITRPDPDLLTLLGDALLALENIGVEPELCERIREVLKAQGTQSSNVERGSIFDDMPF